MFSYTRKFSCQVWAPKYYYLIDKIESVQRFFTRKICGLENLSYSERLNILGLETLNRRRFIFNLILCYKYLHGLVETNNCNFIRIYQSSRTRGNRMKVYKEQCSIDARHQFFTNRIVDIWNSLPAALVLSPSVAVFKRNLAKFRFISFFTLLIIICVFIYFMSCILYCDVIGRLVLWLLINWLIDR